MTLPSFSKHTNSVSVAVLGRTRHSRRLLAKGSEGQAIDAKLKLALVSADETNEHPAKPDS